MPGLAHLSLGIGSPNRIAGVICSGLSMTVAGCKGCRTQVGKSFQVAFLIQKVKNKYVKAGHLAPLCLNKCRSTSFKIFPSGITVRVCVNFVCCQADVSSRQDSVCMKHKVSIFVEVGLAFLFWSVSFKWMINLHFIVLCI